MRSGHYFALFFRIQQLAVLVTQCPKFELSKGSGVGVERR